MLEYRGKGAYRNMKGKEYVGVCMGVGVYVGEYIGL